MIQKSKLSKMWVASKAKLFINKIYIYQKKINILSFTLKQHQNNKQSCIFAYQFGKIDNE